MRVGNCSKTSSRTTLRAARQRDRATRDETAWTTWTLPPAIFGCLAQRYCKCIPVSSRSRRTTPNMRNPGLGKPPALVVASGCQERDIRPCSSPMTASRDAAVRMRRRCRYSFVHFIPVMRMSSPIPAPSSGATHSAFDSASSAVADLPAVGWSASGGLLPLVSAGRGRQIGLARGDGSAVPSED